MVEQQPRIFSCLLAVTSVLRCTSVAVHSSLFLGALTLSTYRLLRIGKKYLPTSVLLQQILSYCSSSENCRFICRHGLQRGGTGSEGPHVVGAQHPLKKIDCLVCSFCFRFVGSIELEIGRRLYMQQLRANESHGCDVGSS
ncbi:hypothetical protein JHK82_050972 [Glycine max]|nr:hypothetical protein JHK82_050972 [Glycine max]